MKSKSKKFLTIGLLAVSAATITNSLSNNVDIGIDPEKDSASILLSSNYSEKIDAISHHINNVSMFFFNKPAQGTIEEHRAQTILNQFNEKFQKTIESSETSDNLKKELKSIKYYLESDNYKKTLSDEENFKLEKKYGVELLSRNIKQQSDISGFADELDHELELSNKWKRPLVSNNDKEEPGHLYFINLKNGVKKFDFTLEDSVEKPLSLTTYSLARRSLAAAYNPTLITEDFLKLEELAEITKIKPSHQKESEPKEPPIRVVLHNKDDVSKPNVDNSKIKEGEQLIVLDNIESIRKKSEISSSNNNTNKKKPS